MSCIPGRCLHFNNLLPPLVMTWCKNTEHGLQARPVASIGGHACCNSGDFCNKELVPELWDYRDPNNVIRFHESGEINTNELCRLI